MFFYIEQTDGTDKSRFVGEDGAVATWDKAQEAQELVQQLNRYAKATNSFMRYRVRRDVSGNEARNAEWRKHIKGLFASGQRRAPPWTAQDWWISVVQREAKDHFPYMSTQHPGFIAYYPTPEHGELGRPVFCTVGKYLRKVGTRFLNDHAIQSLSAQCIASSSNYTLSFAKTAEDMIYVYRHGPASCMSHDLDHYALSVHPITAYAAGDLEVAFLHGPGGVAARALCWPERKIFGRVYPSDNSSAMVDLISRLTARGWRRVTGGNSGFAGARLLRIPLEGAALEKWRARFHVNCDAAFVCPHTDHERYVEDHGTHLVLSKSGQIISADYGQGAAHYKRCTEPGCGQIGHLTRHGSSRGVEIENRFVCSSCTTKYTRCSLCGRYHTKIFDIGNEYDERKAFLNSSMQACQVCIETMVPCASCEALLIPMASYQGFRRSGAPRLYYCRMCVETRKAVRCQCGEIMHQADEDCPCGR